MKTVKIKKLKSRILTILIIISFITIHIGNISVAIEKFKIYNNLKENNTQRMINLKQVSSGDGNTTYWAIMIVVGGGRGYYHHALWGSRSAKGLIRILKNHGWQEDNIKYLFEKQATKEEIFNTFQWLNESGEDQDDIVLFFLEGHGYNYSHDNPPLDEPDGKDECYFPWDEEANGWSWDTYIIDDELAEQFEKLKSKNIVIVVDTCHSAGMIDGKNDLCKSGRVVLTSCNINEASGPIITRMRWLFPHYIIQSFKERADKNKDHWVSAEEAFRYANLPTMIRSTIFNLICYFIEPVPLTQHPQLYDGWPTEENNQQELNIIDLKT
jgi:hypothetical protein